ncbi:MAG TPA: tetratricopeptide repeat protein [Bryobacteraceae bacterium]|nr:tetratricopeptide repeat protein [Bryobacteraceae bacterium]
MGRGERTVRRWEELEGLPVHRLAHEKRGSVYAYRSELDAWWASRKEQITATTDKTPADLQTVVPIVSAQTASRWMWIGTIMALLLIIGALLVARFRREHTPSVRSIAVLPFDNLSHNPSEEWFSDGITETLITELSKVPSLNVISRTSAMQYKNARKSLRQIGSELGVDAVVEGSALRVRDRVRITAQLIAVATDSHLWGRDFDGDFQDVLLLQRKVTQAIAREVGLTLSARQPNRRSENPAAMAAYLKGLYQYNRGDLKSAIGLAREAIQADSELAPAYELLGMALHTTADFHHASYAAVAPEARAALRRALELQPDRGSTLSYLGWSYLVVEHDWVQAEENLRRGFETDPGTGNNYAFLLAAQGKYDDAIHVVDQALQRDPANAFVLTDTGRIYHFARRYDEAIRSFRKALELSPSDSYPRLYLPLSLLLAGRKDEAFEAWLQWRLPLPVRSGDEKEFRDLYHDGGWNAIWLATLDQMPKTPWLHWRQWAAIFLHRTQDALDEAEQMEHTAEAAQLEDPIFDSIRKEPRFQAMLKRVGYPQSMRQ